MAFATTPLFRDDAYRRACEAEIVAIDERGGVILDQTVFYATSGGQPGDTGRFVLDGSIIPIGAAIYGGEKQLLHVPSAAQELLRPGAAVRAEIDWERRHRHMRMHTALHLLCSIVPFPVTGGSVGAEEGRLDFDISDADAVDREALTARLNELIAADHSVTTRWISDDELAANPGLVRTMSVTPPVGSGRVRLVAIGANGSIDLQPCGGTHVRSTGEIGAIAVMKIEKKGRQNRRIRLAFADPS